MTTLPLLPGRQPWLLPAGKRYVFDIETDGLLDTMTRLHSLVIRDYDSGSLVYSYAAGTDESYCYDREPNGCTVCQRQALDRLSEADVLVAHNGLRFDLPALKKLCGWEPKPHQRVIDTLPLARLIWSYLGDLDAKLKDAGKLPGKLWGSHGLEAWGYRLGLQKGEYAQVKQARLAKEHPKLPKQELERLVWRDWDPEMQRYCELDTLVNAALLRHLLQEPYDSEAVELELELAAIIAKQELDGFPFDSDRAAALYGELCGLRQKLETETRAVMGEWWHPTPTVVKRTARRFIAAPWGANMINRGTKREPNIIRGYYELYEEGAEYTRVKRVQFNPASRDHIAQRLILLRGWEPTEKTDAGRWKVDEKTLKGLPWPEAKALCRYFTVAKLAGMLAEGPRSWMANDRRGRIHGSVNPNGANGGRATHSHPNISQVPGVKVKEHKDDTGKVVRKEVLLGEAGEWGFESRSLFTAEPGMVLVGADLSKLELLCLAHFLAKWDGGKYREVVLSGDPHVYMQEAAGAPTRAVGKTLNYALIYGGGDYKLGTILQPQAPDGQKRTIGTRLRRKIMRNFTGLGELTAALGRSAERGYLFGLDGRRVRVRSAHSALNLLLQGAGALLSKRWIVLFNRAMEQELGLAQSQGWFLHAWVHDEIQFSVPLHLVEDAKRLVVDCAARAGSSFGLRVPILAEAKSGRNWAETH